MLALSARGAADGRVVLFVPRWLPVSERAVGLPYRVAPVVSALLANGYDVDLLHEVLDGAATPLARERLRGATAAAVWCAELNPAEQLPGLLAFLEFARAAAPAVPRFAGGGFFALAPPEFSCGELATTVRGDELGALASALHAQRGVALPARQPFSADALLAMDLAPFLQPAPLLFGNHESTLQIPTGLGCAKACPFCFYEHTAMRLLPAPAIARLMEHCHRRHGVRQFQIGELDFLAGPTRALALAEALRRLALPLRWFALASVQDVLRVGVDGLRALAAAGLATLEIGTETGTDDGLRRLGKKFSVDDATTAHARLVAAGIRPVHNFLLGWPGETSRDQRGLLRLADRLHRTAPDCGFNFRLYQAIPSTTFGDGALRGAGPVPRSLAELAHWRDDQRGGMRWLSASAERRARLLTEFVLPLAYDRAFGSGDHPRRRRVFAALARLRCRTGITALPLERPLFGRLCRAGLRTTWLG